MKGNEPIFVADLLRVLDQKLVSLLAEVDLNQWELETIVPSWRIKDIAVHLLDGNIRSLSILRDDYQGDPPQNIQAYDDLVLYLNNLNADWVKAMKRVSPAIIIDLLQASGKAYCDFIESLDPFAKAQFSVAWAGENESYNWFHIAREYTEKWHHQQQIRLALGLENELLTRELYFPFLETSMRALPFHFRNIKAEENSILKICIIGEGGGEWYLKYNNHHWQIVKGAGNELIAEVLIQGELAWRIFSKGIKKEEIIKQSILKGDQDLALHFFEMLAVMA